jgi:AraC-like DNA-binding protein/mannose-6-phosphate isomerase-like protein (cupin superfamily)
MPAPLLQPFPMHPRRRAQVWRHQPAFRRPRHFHAEPELNLVVRGRAVLGIGEHTVRVQRGDVAFFQSGQDHELVDASDDLEMFVLALRPELAERAGIRALPRLSRVPEASIADVAELLSGIASVSSPEVHERSLADLFRGFGRIGSEPHVVSRRTLESLVRDPSLSGDALAHRVGTLPSGISRHFHEDYGVTMVEYRTRLRLLNFLGNVDRGHSLTRSALDAGFGSYAQCHRVFQRVFGIAPSTYFGGARARLDAALATFDCGTAVE